LVDHIEGASYPMFGRIVKCRTGLLMVWLSFVILKMV